MTMPISQTGQAALTQVFRQYVLTDKWILAQNLGYPRYKIQFPKNMKLKKNED